MRPRLARVEPLGKTKTNQISCLFKIPKRGRPILRVCCFPFSLSLFLCALCASLLFLFHVG